MVGVFLIAIAIAFVWNVVRFQQVSWIETPKNRKLAAMPAPRISSKPMIGDVWRITSPISPQSGQYVVQMEFREIVVLLTGSRKPAFVPKSLVIPLSAVRWFGLTDSNKLSIYADMEGDWLRIRLPIKNGITQEILDQLTAKIPACTGDAIPDYGPIKMREASENVYGEWSSGSSWSLFLLPRYVLLIQNNDVQQVIQFKHIRRVALIQRSDQKKVLQFTASGKSYSFSGSGTETLAEKLAQAAGCVLEKSAPKKKRGE
jgi:hypothetical protein